MKTVFTGMFAALVLGAAIASPQAQQPAPTPSGQTPPSTAQPAGQTKPADQTKPSTSPTAAGKTTTYRGFLRGSETSGWTISPIADRAGASAAPGATATSGAAAGAAATTYSVIAPAGSKTDFAAMADQCVEIVGMLAPESGMGGSSAGAVAASPGAAAKAHRGLNVTTIRAVQGGCTQ